MARNTYVFNWLNAGWDMTYSLIIPKYANHSWNLPPTFTNEGVEFSKFSQKCVRVDFSHKKGGIVKIGIVKIVALKKQSPPFDVHDHTCTR